MLTYYVHCCVEMRQCWHVFAAVARHCLVCSVFL